MADDDFGARAHGAVANHAVPVIEMVGQLPLTLAVTAGFAVADAGGTGCGWWGVFGISKSGQEGEIAANVVTTFNVLKLGL